MMSLDDGGLIIGEGIGHAGREVCVFPGYMRPLSERAALEGLSCPVWPRVAERKIRLVCFEDAKCTSFGIAADVLAPHGDEQTCFARQEIAGDAVILKDGVVTLRRDCDRLVRSARGNAGMGEVGAEFGR